MGKRERELERQRQEGGFYAFTVSCSLLPGKNRVDGVSGGMAWVRGAVRGAQHNVCVCKSNALLLAEKNILSPSLYGRASFSL